MNNVTCTRCGSIDWVYFCKRCGDLEKRDAKIIATARAEALKEAADRAVAFVERWAAETVAALRAAILDHSADAGKTREP